MDAPYNIELFADLPEAEVAWVRDHSRTVRLAAGEFFLREDGPAQAFYIVLAGELQILRTINGQEQVIGTTPRGIIGGEVALLTGTPSQVSARAIEASHLLVLDPPAFRQMFTYAPALGARVLSIAVGRMHGLVRTQVQQEKMAALGRLTAGLAHELKNPAAATRRAVTDLRAVLAVLQAQAVQLSTLGLTTDQIEHLLAFQQRILVRADAAAPLSPLEQSDCEEQLGEWLETRGIDNGWEMAACFAGMAVDTRDLETLLASLPAASWPGVLAWLQHTLETIGLLNEIEQGTQRISDLVGAIKSYSYKDQAAVEVDIHKGLDSTIAVLGHKLKQGTVALVREYDPDLPRIHGRSGELNQVWTNLIDNAVDALAGAGTIRVSTRCENDFVMVEIADNGPGIPPDVRPHLFEPFFTTKAAGSGTGLGLDISYRIVQEHHGSIEVQSEPGHTRFIVRLPVGPGAKRGA